MKLLTTGNVVEQIRLGTFLSYLNLILDNLLSLLLVPFILMQLGQSEYGLYVLMGSLVSSLLILDIGLNSTIVRYIAKYRAEKNKAGEISFFTTCLVIYAVLSFVVVIIGLITLVNMQVIFGHSLSENEITKASLLFVILVANLALSLPLSSFKSVVNGYEHFIFPRLLLTIRSVVRPVILLILLLNGYKSVAIVVLDTILNVTVLSCIMIYSLIVLKVRVLPKQFDRFLLKEIFAFSFFVFLGTVVDQLYWRSGQVILGIVSNTNAVAVFSIGIQFVIYFMTFSAVIGELLLPKATQMVINNASDESLTDLLIRVGRMQLIILGILLVGFSILGRNFILLWVGPDYENAWLIAMIIVFPLMIPLCQTSGVSILMAKKRHSFRSVVYLLVALVNIGLSLLLTKLVGIWGPAIGTSISLAFGSIVVINLYYHFKIGLNIPRFIRNLSRDLLPAISVCILVGFLVLFIPGLSWPVLILQGILLSALYVTVIWLFGMNRDERGLIMVMLARLKRRIL